MWYNIIIGLGNYFFLATRLLSFSMDTMHYKDKKFLECADLVASNYKRRIAKLQMQYIALTDYEVGEGSPERLIEILEVKGRLRDLEAKAEAHETRWRELQRERERVIALNRLCSEASALAGSDGISFMAQVKHYSELESE